MIEMMSFCQLRALRCMFKRRQIIAISRTYSKFPHQDEAYTKITVPRIYETKLHKHQIQAAKRQGQHSRKEQTPMVIASKRKEYQFYKGDKFKNFNASTLASHGWKNRHCGLDYFTLVPHEPNPATVCDQRFEEFGLDERIMAFLKEEGLDQPTKVQGRTIPHMMQGKPVVCAAETGSGKTYAYLLPIVHHILQMKDDCTTGNEVKPFAPYCVIMVPSRELVFQVQRFCEKMAKHTGITSFAYTKHTKKEITDNENLDILILSPASVKKIRDSKRLDLSRLMAVVVDEADNLLDDSFSDETCAALTAMQVGITSSTRTQGIHAGILVSLFSATFPHGLEQTVGTVLPVDKMEVVTTPGLHRAMPHVPQKFIRARHHNKLGMLVQVLKEQTEDTITLIFCNKAKAADWLSKTLIEAGIQNIGLTAKKLPKQRRAAVESLLSGKRKLIVTTDILSRGMDTSKVNHVINFDFPSHIVDYIHRAGRVGRVGTHQWAQVTSFVTHVWDVDMVWNIESAVRMNRPLQNVDANVKRKLIQRALMKEEENVVNNNQNNDYSEDVDDNS